MRESQILRRFEPKELGFSLIERDAFEMFIKRHYRPKENIEHLHQLVVYAILKEKVSTGSVRKSQYYESLLLKDLEFYLDKAYHLEPDFLRVVFHFTAWVMGPDDAEYYNILKLCMQNAVKHFDELSVYDLAVACSFS